MYFHPELQSSRRESSASLLALACCFGMLTGLAEVLILGIRKLVFHQAINQGADVVWMAPLSNLVFFLIVGSVLGLGSRIAPNLITRRVAMFVLAFPAFFAVFFMFHPQLHKYAAVLLAAGLAAQTARWVLAKTACFARLSPRMIVGMTVVIAGLALTIFSWQFVRERRALAKLPPAAPGSPNVLFIVLDTVRAQNLSLYGYERPTTPNLERLSRSGVRFDRALSTAPWTLPSHGSMFTGRYPFELSAGWMTPLDATYPTVAEVLSNRGYLTAGFVANTGYASYEFGLDRGFAHYEDYSVSLEAIVASSSLGRFITDSRRIRRLVGYYQTLGRKTAAQVNRDFLSWLSVKDDRPFFVFLNYYDVHGPYVASKPFDTRFGSGQPVEWSPTAHKNDVSPEEIQAMVDGYDNSMAYLDHQLGLLFDDLERRGALKNTLVIITSDHGEEFGEHELFDHGNTLYLPSVHVPLLILPPDRIPGGKNVSEPVTLRDLPSTITDLLNFKGSVKFPGSSLARYWCDSCDRTDGGSSPLLSEVAHAKNLPTWIPVSKGDMKSLTVDGIRYVRNGDGVEELYDLRFDAAEKQNLLDSDAGHSALPQFRNSLKLITGN